MKKRFLPALLVLSAILFYSPMSVVAGTGNEISAETGDPYIYEYKMPPDIYEEEFGVSDEVLALNTPDLLEAFLQSGRLQGLYWTASTAAAFESSLRWCSNYKELAELVCRTDFIPTIETYAKEIMINSQNLSEESEDMLMGFKILLRCEAVKSLVASSPDILSDCPYLQRIYDSFTTSFQSSESRSVEGIDYAYFGIYTTEGNKSAVLYTASRELTEDEKTAANKKYDKSTRTRLYEPTAKYNCHSYAWYYTSSLNPYWLDDIPPQLGDSTCVVVPSNSISVNDIVVYYDRNGFLAHSGVVASVPTDGNPIIRSKWGAAGVYVHDIADVPAGYQSSDNGVSVRFYSYHYNINKFTGTEYHSGKFHYYQYADICNLCGTMTNSSFQPIICSGPPCPAFIFTKPEEDE